MTLQNTKTLLQQAEQQGIGLGAFNVGSLEMIRGVIQAAEELQTPVVMQVTESRLHHFPLHIIGPAMVGAARAASVDVAVHLDHGSSLETIRQALEIGFTSIMYDGSALPYEENLRNTRRVVALAADYGAATECEIGVVGGREENEDEKTMQYTDPAQAHRFSRECGADAMAVAIGNAHGVYKAAPKLRFDILQEIREGSALPLVLHGGSGISDADFQEAIRCGIRKVNIATASFRRSMQRAQEYLAGPDPDPFGLGEALVQGTYENVKHHIEVFTFRD